MIRFACLIIVREKRIEKGEGKKRSNEVSFSRDQQLKITCSYFDQVYSKKKRRRKKNRKKIGSRYQFLSFETPLFRSIAVEGSRGGGWSRRRGRVWAKKESKLNSRDKWRGVDLPGKLSRDPWRERGSDPETRLLAKARGTARWDGEDASLEAWIRSMNVHSTNAVIKH